MIFSAKKADIHKPIRADQEFTFGMAKTNLYLLFAFFLLFLLCVFFGILAFRSLNMPRLVTVIDTATGRTFASNSMNLNEQLVHRQLVYYSRQFIESFLSYSFQSMRSDRKTAKDFMHPTMLAKDLPANWLEDESVQDAERTRASAIFEWKIKPFVTLSNDPRYSVFCQVERVIKRPGYKDQATTYNIKLDWGRLRNNQDAFNRPHDLVLLGFMELDATSSELKEQLNLIK